MNTDRCAPIAILTDFGTRDGFVGIMKGVIAGISPHANVIDISHEVLPQDVGHGAYILFAAYAFFPKGTVFCAVVDPGVGSDRQGICIKTRNYYFIGPDNGICWPAADADGIEVIYNLTNPRFHLEEVSATFHGRDIFAPVSAHLARATGVERLSLLGEPLPVCRKYEFPEIRKKEGGIELTVLCWDHFGNMVLNITRDAFNGIVKKGRFELTVNGHCVSKVYRTYDDAVTDELFLVCASGGRMEISMKNGSARQRIQPQRHQRCLLRPFD